MMFKLPRETCLDDPFIPDTAAPMSAFSADGPQKDAIPLRGELRRNAGEFSKWTYVPCQQEGFLIEHDLKATPFPKKRMSSSLDHFVRKVFQIFYEMFRTIGMEVWSNRITGTTLQALFKKRHGQGGKSAASFYGELTMGTMANAISYDANFSQPCLQQPFTMGIIAPCGYDKAGHQLSGFLPIGKMERGFTSLICAMESRAFKKYDTQFSSKFLHNTHI